MAGELMPRLERADPVQPETLVLPDLEQLAAQWPKGDAERGPTRRAPRGRWTGGFLTLSLAALVTTGSAAATLTVVTGNPLGQVESVAIAPAASTERIAHVTADDPDGHAPWGVKVGRSSEQGLVCLTVGQVRGGELGIVGLDGVFRTRAVDGAAECAVRPTGSEILANGRTFVGRTPAGNTSVVYGIAGDAVGRVVVRYPDGASKRLPLSPSGVFVVARRGSLTQTSPSLLTGQLRDASGHFARIIDFGDPRRYRRGVVEHPLDPKEPVR